MGETNEVKAAGIRAGFGRRTINPEKGISLAGYFNPRPNEGVLDDLSVKVLLLARGEELAGLICFDLIITSSALIERVRAALRAAGLPLADTIPLASTHTHTGPSVGGIMNMSDAQEAYLAQAAAATVEAMKDALADLAPAELLCGSVTENPYAFNRRYWMSDGRVVTNPGKNNARVVNPEGPVDRVVSVLEVRRQGAPLCLVANICNHCDTTSGMLVSADWPGHMERAVQEHLGRPVPVVTLISPAGNVNHINLRDLDQPVYGVEESRRIGRGYARILLRAREAAAPLADGPVALATRRVTIFKRTFTPDQLEKARQVLAKPERTQSGNLTSEDLARGSDVVERFFAQQLLAYVEKMPDSRDFDLAALSVGRELAIVFLPGEPFTEIALAIRKASAFRRTFVASLSNGQAGYIAMRENFGRGGYEVLPVVGGGPREDTAELLIAEGGKLVAGG